MAHSWCLRHRSQRSGCKTIGRRRFIVVEALQECNFGLKLIELRRKLAENSLLKGGLYFRVNTVALVLELGFM